MFIYKVYRYLSIAQYNILNNAICKTGIALHYKYNLKDLRNMERHFESPTSVN